MMLHIFESWPTTYVALFAPNEIILLPSTLQLNKKDNKLLILILH